MSRLFARWRTLGSIMLVVLVVLAAVFVWDRRFRFAGSEPTHIDIFYTSENDIRRSLDIYLPAASDSLAPTVMILSGNRGNKTNFRYFAGQLTLEGFAVVLPNFRIDPLTYADSFCALAWIHSHGIDYNLDTDNVFVIGWSSGGGMTTEILAINSPNELLDDCPHEAPSEWLSGAVLLAAGSDRWPESGWRTNTEPVIWIDGNEPPVLLIHGRQDAAIPVDDSIQLNTILMDENVETDLLILEDADHFFPLPGNNGYDEMRQAILDFMLASIN